MTNVLPPEEKKRLWSFYRGRFILVGSIASSIVALIAIIALAPTYFMLSQNRSIIEAALAQETQGSETERAEAFKTQAFLKEVKPYVVVGKTPIRVVEEALKIKPAGILVNRISFSKESNGRIVLAGTSASRDLINTFRKNLEASGLYSSVTVPVGDLVGGSGRFTITLMPK